MSVSRLFVTKTSIILTSVFYEQTAKISFKNCLQCENKPSKQISILDVELLSFSFATAEKKCFSSLTALAHYTIYTTCLLLRFQGHAEIESLYVM